MPCVICNEAVSRASRVDVRHASDVVESAKSCLYCRIILDVLNKHDVEAHQRLHITNDDDTSQTRATHGIKVLVIKAGQVYGSQFDFVVRNLRGLDAGALADVLYSGYTYTGSSRALGWAQRQIARCQMTHDTCRMDPHPMPDRLLWLGNGDVNDPSWLESDVKLYESQSEVGLYATLSHRWGLKQPLQLLRANMAEFKVRIAWLTLPKTFQQAIHFARALGVRYLWIDSLCIIQDSREDWKEQSVKMASIYENSYITLAASVAENSDSGCFTNPPPFLVGYVTDGFHKAKPDEPGAILSLVEAANQSTVVFVRGSSEHPMPSVQLPLLTRGWVFQERLLSPRILHFGHLDLIFECSSCIECYCRKQVGAASRSVRSHPPKLQHANALGKGLFKGVGGHENAYAERWCAAVEEYSQLDLTFTSDRLPAIAGLAKQMARYMTDARYMCGLWTSRLVVHLSWRRRTDLPPANSAKYRPGPSWTWVTISGAVAYPRGTFYLQRPVVGFEEFADPWPTVAGVDFNNEGDDDFMTLKHGSITLHGVLVEVRLRRIRTSQRDENGIVDLSGAERFSSVVLDHEPEDEELLREWRHINPKWARLFDSCGERLSLERTVQDTEDLSDVFPLPLQRGSLKGVLEHKDRMWAFCLGMWMTDGSQMDQFLLLEHAETSSNAFRRIGCGECAVKKSPFRGISERHEILLQ
ncbi:uncharacterized protein PV09_09433 [Verruconis gallopava]|uniref:Heterokaryon incompatibility domain-containing protein n=1 Tax=Verruconis gallopava TaxID=253628 RepID=A0A0D1X9H0_9PEZI|nr:uncharacterized protein PV09_09433 [Verruconis gallopava]KIV98820.1 hypothetical protein PV09_09433 [Verruconis gallopava]